MEQPAQKFDQKVSTANVVLVDIEGTTSSISFVKDTLFPYALANVESFLTEQFDSDDIKEAVKALREQAKKDKEEKVEGFVAIPEEDASKEDIIKAVVDSVKWQMSNDRKVAPLKTLQGLIWSKAYANKEIKGHVYADVPTALESWVESGRRVFIYSSGSVAAQKLLFGHSESGDLLKFFSGYFDTAVGAKQESESYKNIVKEIKCEAQEIVFLTDIVQEAKAAVDAGLNAVLVKREGNAELLEDDVKHYCVITSFADLPVATSGKRKPQDSGDEVPPTKVAKTEEVSDAKATDIKIAPDSSEEKMETPETVTGSETKTEEKMECDSADPAEKLSSNTTEEKSEATSGKTETLAVNANNDCEKMEVDAVPETVIENKTEETSTGVEKKVDEVKEKEDPVVSDMKNVEEEKKPEIEDKKVDLEDKKVETENESDHKKVMEKENVDVENKKEQVEDIKTENKKIETEDKNEVIKVADTVDRVQKSEITEEVVSSSVAAKNDEPIEEDKQLDPKEMEIDSETTSKPEEKGESKKVIEAVAKEAKTIESPNTIESTATVDSTVVEKEVKESTESSKKEEIIVDSTTDKVTEEKMDEDSKKIETNVSSVTEEIKADVEDVKMDDTEIKPTTTEATPADVIETVTESKTEIISNTEEKADEKMNTDETSKIATESTIENKDSAPSTSTMETDSKENVTETPKTTEEKKESEDTKVIDDKILKEQNSVSDSETKVAAEIIESKEAGETSTEIKAEKDKQESVENGSSTSTVNGSEGDSEKIEEAKTNGADSDKENDNEKPKDTTNGSSNTTNGVAEESEVKVKKVVTETSTATVVEATES